MTPAELAPVFFLAAVTIVVVSHLVALLANRLGQPRVVGEMMAGIVLGPSLFGLLAPDLSAHIFPTELRPILYTLGQIGLVALMLRAGYEFRRTAHRRDVSTALAVSAAGIVLPLVLGILLTFAAVGRVSIFVDGVPTVVTALFIGVALAITAFPMLARIIVERGLADTSFGRISLAAGGTDDVVAWILLAVVLGMHRGSSQPAVVAIGGALVLGVVLVFVVRPWLNRVLADPGRTDDSRLVLLVVVAFAAAWFTDIIHLYAVFGAFCVGLALPQLAEVDTAVERVDTLSRALFLPMFFTYSGLNTRLDQFSGGAVLVFAAAAVVLAVIGKFGGCFAAARFAGQDRFAAARIGALMNARGLMQLIALNIGLQAGIIGTAMFTALIIVATVTTIMAVPSLNLIDRYERRQVADPGDPAAAAAASPSDQIAGART